MNPRKPEHLKELADLKEQIRIRNSALRSIEQRARYGTQTAEDRAKIAIVAAKAQKGEKQYLGSPLGPRKMDGGMESVYLRALAAANMRKSRAKRRTEAANASLVDVKACKDESEQAKRAEGALKRVFSAWAKFRQGMERDSYHVRGKVEDYRELHDAIESAKVTK